MSNGSKDLMQTLFLKTAKIFYASNALEHSHIQVTTQMLFVTMHFENFVTCHISRSGPQHEDSVRPTAVCPGPCSDGF